MTIFDERLIKVFMFTDQGKGLVVFRVTVNDHGTLML